MNDEMPDVVERRRKAPDWTHRRELGVIIGATLIVFGVGMYDVRACVILMGLVVCGSGLIGLLWGK
jgi:hypothetical protein